MERKIITKHINKYFNFIIAIMKLKDQIERKNNNI